MFEVFHGLLKELHIQHYGLHVKWGKKWLFTSLCAGTQIRLILTDICVLQTYIYWTAHSLILCPKQQNLNLIPPVHQTLIICPNTKSNSEIEFIMKVLADDYSLDIVQSSTRAKIAEFNKPEILWSTKVSWLFAVTVNC